MSIFTDIRQEIVRRVAQFIAGGDPTDTANRERLEHLAQLQLYYDGHQNKMLRVRSGQFDDNITVNLISLIVDKSVSALVGDPADGQGVTWTFPSETEDEKPEQIAWLDAQWEANKKDIFLHKNALAGAESGFPAVKFVPDGAGNVRLLNQSAMMLRVETLPNDIDTIVKYTIGYTVEEDGKDVSYREVTTPTVSPLTAETVKTSTWVVKLERKDKGKWTPVSETPWDYTFPPILCWQNLPAIDTQYGKSDIDDVIQLQDRYNFLVSNLSKVIRLFAHPQRYTVNLTNQAAAEGTQFGPDMMPGYHSDGSNGSGIFQLPPVGDLPGAMMFLQSIRQNAFDLAREVDTNTIKDKVGQITNFVMRVLYRDTLEKLGTKRMLYGEAYREINRRLLMLGGYEPETCTINWPDPLPINEVEETTALQTDLNMGVVSKQTVAEVRGYDWDDEQERMGNEKQASDNVGATLLRDFFRTGGNTPRVPTEQGGQNASENRQG